MELSDYIKIFRLHWLGITIIALVAIGAGLLFSLAQPKIYAANASGFVTAGASGSPSEASVGDTVAKSRATSYVTIAQSRSVARRVRGALDRDETAQALISRITVTQPIDTVLIKVSARDSEPQRAEELANAWIVALAAEVESIEGGAKASLRIEPVESAEQPTSPVSPNVPRNVGLSAVLGLLLGGAFGVFRSQLDRRLRRPEDIEQQFGRSVLVSVPRDGALASGGHGTQDFVATGPTSTPGANRAWEAFLRLRTNLQFANVDDPPRVMVVSSPFPADGKSTIAANLAAAIAVANRSVVLVDGDLRRPTVSNRYGETNAPGLTDVLVGKIELEDALQDSAIPRLKILGAGIQRPPNPSELLGAEAMRSLLWELRQEHTVIIDSPPLIPVADAVVLSVLADGVIVVVAAGKTLDTHLRQSLDSIEKVGGTVLGVVINKMQVRRTARDDYYSSYYVPSSAHPPHIFNAIAEKVHRPSRPQDDKETGRETSPPKVPLA